MSLSSMAGRVMAVRSLNQGQVAWYLEYETCLLPEASFREEDFSNMYHADRHMHHDDSRRTCHRHFIQSFHTALPSHREENLTLFT